MSALPDRTRGAAVPATRLVCTIGPASVGRLDELVAAGMSVARLNLSHGDPASHRRAAAAVRAAAAAADREVGILADLPGPKVRLGPLPGGELELESGAPFELRPPGAPGDAGGAATTHAALASDLEPGDRILLADGAVELRAGRRSGDRIATTVERGGTIRSGAGVSVPSERLSLPPLTSRDLGLLPLLHELEADFVGQSFVRSADDVEDLRRRLAPGGPRILAKVETRPAVERIDAIVEVADGIMVARGDLGVELPFEEVPLVQKRLVAAARSAGRPVIVATQMLESMTAAPRPTRAEASDVANAVLDGADAVMLSAETAIGAYPVLAAEAAVRIATVADRFLVGEDDRPRPGGIARGTADHARAVILAAIALARADPDVAWIGCFTRTGRTARTLSSLRPPVPIVAVSPDVRVTRSLSLHRGVVARAGEPAEDGPGIGRSLRDGLRSVGARAGESAVLVASTAGGDDGPNLVEVVRLE